ncbi:MAG: hypothetical protein ACXWW7_16535 [Nocardioides sp.]
MWELGTVAAAIAALLVPAPPGQAPPLLPTPEPGPACVAPDGGTLGGCPRDERRATVLCIVPVTGFVTAPLEPTCPEPVPAQRGRVVPLTP